MKTIKAMIVAGMLVWFPAQASAGDYEVQNVMDDAMYGAGVGAMVGLGLMLLTDKPTDNWNYITRGLGVGIIGGAAYGIFRSSKAFAEVEDGQINLGVPSPEFTLRQTPAGMDLVMTTHMVVGHF